MSCMTEAITPSSSRVVSAACSQYMTPSRPFSFVYTHLRRTASGDSKLMKSLPFQRYEASASASQYSVKLPARRNSSVKSLYSGPYSPTLPAGCSRPLLTFGTPEKLRP